MNSKKCTINLNVTQKMSRQDRGAKFQTLTKSVSLIEDFTSVQELIDEKFQSMRFDFVLQI